MKTLIEIEALFSANRLDDAENAVLQLPQDADTLYMLGRIAWKRGQRSRAITFYEESAALNPDGYAATALEQARAIMAFYNKDLYNP